MRQKVLQPLVLLIVTTALLLLLGACSLPFSSQQENKVCFQQQCFIVEIAKTPAEREVGLMQRETLAEDHGMLFMFPRPGLATFWMKDTLIPLDIIWIDESRKVVFISPDTPPCPEEPCLEIRTNAVMLYVLEIKAGMAEEIGLREGETLDFELSSTAFSGIE